MNAYDYLVNNDFVDPSRIGIVGSSYGATIAAMVTGNKPIKSLILRAPAAYSSEMKSMKLIEMANQKTDKFNKMEKIEKSPAIESLSDFHGDLFIIKSENDTIIPDRMPNVFFEHAKKVGGKKLVIMKDATHNLTDDKWRE